MTAQEMLADASKIAAGFFRISTARETLVRLMGLGCWSDVERAQSIYHECGARYFYAVTHDMATLHNRCTEDEARLIARLCEAELASDMIAVLRGDSSLPAEHPQESVAA